MMNCARSEGVEAAPLKRSSKPPSGFDMASWDGTVSSTCPLYFRGTDTSAWALAAGGKTLLFGVSRH
jgi:hypothetical protein